MWCRAASKPASCALLLMLIFGLGAACIKGGSESSDAEGSANQSAVKDSDAEERDEGNDRKRRPKDGDNQEDEDEAVPVEVATLGRGEIESVLRFSTNLEA